MKLSEDIVLDVLSKFGAVAKKVENTEFQFSSAQLLSQNITEYSQDVLYIGEPRQLRGIKGSELRSICIVCIGKQEFFEKFFQKHAANFICIYEECELSEVVNEIFSTFTRLNKWQHNLILAEVSDQGCQAVVDIGKEIFQDNPLIAVSSSYDIIASSHKSTPYNARLNEVLQKGYYDKDTTDQFSRMGYMRNGDKYSKPTLAYPPNFMNCAFAVRTFYNDGIMRFFFVVYFVNRAPTKTDFELFDHFAEWAGKYLQHKTSITHSISPTELFLADLINETQKDELYVIDRARFLKLPVNSNFRLCIVKWEEFSQSQAGYLRMRLRAGLTFPHYKLMFFQKSLLLLIYSETVGQRSEEEFNENLDILIELLNTCQAYAGFSTIFTTLFKINIAYKQAMVACEYGRKLNMGSSVYYYSKYYIYDMINSYTNKFALEDMYVQKLQSLQSTDNEEGSNFILLKNYLLTERNISATARIMFMHRNSVIYRIAKIQDTLGLSLDDPNVRLRLLISYKIWELINLKESETNLALVNDDPENQEETILFE